MHCHLLPRLVLLVVLGLALALPACRAGRPRHKVYPVSGQVLLNGQPLAKVTVAFHPVDAAKFEIEHPSADTDRDGRFALTTYLKDDGAPEGEYRVTFYLLLGPDDSGSDQTTGNLLPDQYSRPDTSTFTVTVKPTANALEPFQLTGEVRKGAKAR